MNSAHQINAMIVQLVVNDKNLLIRWQDIEIRSSCRCTCNLCVEKYQPMNRNKPRATISIDIAHAPQLRLVRTGGEVIGDFVQSFSSECKPKRTIQMTQGSS